MPPVKPSKKKEINYFIRKRDKALDKLNRRLIKNEFYQLAFYDVEKDLPVDFNDEATLLNLREQLSGEMDKCWRFYSIFKNGFTDMEEQVHEIRRRLRWFSLYGQSFNGSIVLVKKTPYSWEKKFLTKKDEVSAFNKLPVHRFDAHIVFDQKAFAALNAVIGKLGLIKNKGLRVEELAKSIRKTQDVHKAEAKTMAFAQLQPNYTEEELFGQAQALLAAFFDTYGIHKLLLQ